VHPPKPGSKEANYKPCFVAGTLVLGNEGAIAIELIGTGDDVRGQHAGAPTSSKSYAVLDAQQGRTSNLVHVGIGADRISCTRSHPFSVLGRGWVEARALKPGDQLETNSGKPLSVTSITHERLAGDITTFSLIVAECLRVLRVRRGRRGSRPQRACGPPGLGAGAVVDL